MNNKSVLLAVVAAALLGSVVGGLAAFFFGPSLFREPIAEAQLRRTLRDNPDIVLEALQALQDRRNAANQVQARAAIVANRDALLEDTHSVVAGNPKGDVTVVEFFDYRCPYCREAITTVRGLLKADPKVRLVYKEFPVLGPESLAAARVAVAARRDPRYEALHDALMVAPSPLDEAHALQIAADLGFDREALAAAANAPEIDEILKANHTLAISLGITGTPAFIIGDKLALGIVPLDGLRKLVADARELNKQAVKNPGD